MTRRNGPATCYVRLGYGVLQADTDTIWAFDPFPMLLAMASDGASVIVQWDFPIANAGLMYATARVPGGAGYGTALLEELAWRIKLFQRAPDRGVEVPLAGQARQGGGEGRQSGPGSAGLERVRGGDAALDAALGPPVDAAEPSATIAVAAATLALAAAALATTAALTAATLTLAAAALAVVAAALDSVEL